MAAQKYLNFYETVKEANIRLQYTVVLYDGYPYFIFCITDDNRPDGIFRVYMEPIGHPEGSVIGRIGGIPHDYPSNERGKLMDEWMAKYPDSGVVRKKMNSPMFNKFRPFPLGMCNTQSKTVYLERQPQRQTHQGLTQQMICQSNICLDGGKQPRFCIDMQRSDFRDCVLGIYPSVEDCIKNLTDPDIMNTEVGFHRDFAFVRGPIDTIFLAYKTDVVGLLENGDTSRLRLPKTFEHTKEVIIGLNVFDNVIVK